ncbi:MAG TPA: M4 family metallopeptidase, partial [Polyangium sp.]|nr:M4 family metallopeptidase [Polyangium sp.]
HTHGFQYRGIERDLTDVTPTIAAKDAMAKLKQGHLQANAGRTLIPTEEKSELVVYMHQGKARLAWLVTYNADTQQGGHPSRPFAIMDAKSGEELRRWEGLTTDAATASGPGGNGKTGQYQYGSGKPLLEVTIPSAGSTTCVMQNADVTTVNLNGGTSGSTAYSFTCPTNTVKSINGAYSPLNDAHYFGGVVSNLYKQWLGTPVLTSRMVMRVHYGTNWDNATWDGGALNFGDGNADDYPLVTLDVVAHEASHGFTEQHSRLTYAYQSGGIDEAFSDISGEAAEYFSRGMNDFVVGLDVVKAFLGVVRYMEEPSLDGFSINHASRYNEWMNPHYSSGVYNRAFYILAHRPNWNTRKAWEIFARANKNYWTANIDFNQAACGVIQSAINLGYSTSEVIDAFAQVGVQCSSYPATMLDVALQSGVELTNQSGSPGAINYYYIDVPNNSGSVVVTTSGGSGDADLYVRLGNKPLTKTNDCQSLHIGNTESCTISPRSAGRYYILVRGSTGGYSGATIKATL